MIASPYPLRFRYERGAIREYASFSWPLLAGTASGVLMFQVPITIAARSLGAAAVGAITLASQITQYTRRVDDIVTHALYPAICAVKDQTRPAVRVVLEVEPARAALGLPGRDRRRAVRAGGRRRSSSARSGSSRSR